MSADPITDPPGPHRVLGVLRAQWPLLVVLACVLAGLVLIGQWHWRRGSMMIGAAVGLAGLLRWLLPVDRAGLLVVRSKPLDVAWLVGSGAAIIALAWVVPPAY